jgi:TolB-like protein
MGLAGCQSAGDVEKYHSLYVTPERTMAPYTVHQYVSDLSVQLSNITGVRKRNASIAVMSFFKADGLGESLAGQQMSGLSQQIQESLLTQFTQLGYHAVEHRLENQLTLLENADSMLSRKLDNLRERQNIDFVIAGTLTQQQHAYIVNARLIDMQSSRVVSAATTEIPINVMWSDEKVQQRDGAIYRTEY